MIRPNDDVDDDGIPCVPYVPFRCPTCGRGKPFTSNVRGRVRCHTCRACGQRYRSLELGPESVKDWATRYPGAAAVATEETSTCRVQAPAGTRVQPNPAHPPARRAGRLTELERRELAVANELLPEDLAAAANVLQGWRVRLATVRTEKRLADDAEPLLEDLELLERVVTRTGSWVRDEKHGDCG